MGPLPALHDFIGILLILNFAYICFHLAYWHVNKFKKWIDHFSRAEIFNWVFLGIFIFQNVVGILYGLYRGIGH
ncbi:hypothetical protein OKN36_19860 [Furfurilactobacillus sp. OKN36]